jgi:hypothetical protein
MRWLFLLACIPAVAAAHPPPYDPEPSSWRDTPALLEWSTWARAGFGVEETVPTVAARASQPPSAVERTTWAFALGADVTLPVTHGVRFGPWLELGGGNPTFGAELLVTRAPSQFRMFFYSGEGVWTVRAGASSERATVATGWGYRCPWRL